MTRTIPLLLLIAAGFSAEGEPATTPAAQPAQPALDAGLEQPRAPVAADPPRSTRRTGIRVARVATDVPTWDGRVRLGAGYDSNALLDSDPDTAQAATAVYSGEGTIGWRPVANQRDFVKATGTIAYDRRPQLEKLDTTKLALGIAGARQGDTLTTGGNLSAARYWLDGDGAAAELRGGFSLGWLRSTSADLLAIEAALLHFDASTDRPEGASGLVEFGDADDRSGALLAGAWRHWWQLTSGSRVEAAVRAGHFFANGERESYDLIQPWAALRMRTENWELEARGTLEGRDYDGDETAILGTLTASADRRLGHGVSAGAYAALSARDSSIDDRDYERWQLGARLTWAFTAEE